MSEAIHHKAISRGGPSIVPEKTVDEHIGALIPFPRREDEEIDTEKLDFSETPPEVAIEFLMSELGHPSRIQHQGIELVADIERLIPTKAEKQPEPTSLASRLVEIVRTDTLGSDEVYDHKVEHDPVFQLLADKLLYSRDRRDLRAQFEVTRNLVQLRSTLEDETHRDKEWRDVIERLFN